MITYKKLIIVFVALFVLVIFACSDEIHDAVQKGDLAKVKELLEKDPKVVNAKNINSRTPLHFAALRGHKDIAEVLISMGADLNLKDYWGNTPIWYAVTRAHKEVINLLLANNVEIPTKGEDSRKLLHRAASVGNKEVTEIMIAKGVDINISNYNDGTLLHSAASGNLRDLIERLIEKGQNADARNRYSLTPLHLAASKGNKEAVESLIAKGADINATSITGKTALHFAEEADQKEIVDILIAKGADQSPAQFPVLKGEYLGQKPPGSTPELFALGIVSSMGVEHSCPTFSPDGKELYWMTSFDNNSRSGILYMKLENNQWTAPQVASFCGQFEEVSPSFSPDGKKLYFISFRPLDEGDNPSSGKIWVVERNADSWSEPKPLDAIINSEKVDWAVSVTNYGTLYFSCVREDGIGWHDIYRSRLVNGKYTKPENLGDSINTKFYDGTAHIAPDESYLIFYTHTGQDSTDDGLKITFRTKDDSWTKPKNISAKINFVARGGMISPDGKYLFFYSSQNRNFDIYWMDAKIIDELKPEEFK